MISILSGSTENIPTQLTDTTKMDFRSWLDANLDSDSDDSDNEYENVAPKQAEMGNIVPIKAISINNDQNEITVKTKQNKTTPKTREIKKKRNRKRMSKEAITGSPKSDVDEIDTTSKHDA
jgi:hypothetical protein